MNFINLQVLWTSGWRNWFAMSVATIIITFSSVAFAQLDEGVFRQQNTSDALMKAYAEFRFLTRTNNPKAAIAGDAVLKMAEEEFGAKHKIMGFIHMDIATVKQGLQDYTFEDIEPHILQAILIFSSSDGKIGAASAILLTTLAEEYIQKGRFDEAVAMLGLVHRDMNNLFNMYFEGEVDQLKRKREFFEMYPNDAFAESQYRLALRSHATWLRAQGETEKAKAYELTAQSLELPNENPASKMDGSIPENENPYVLCLLPNETNPVHHKRRACLKGGGSELSE